jgi:hypothetical protein
LEHFATLLTAPEMERIIQEVFANDDGKRNIADVAGAAVETANPDADFGRALSA